MTEGTNSVLSRVFWRVTAIVVFVVCAWFLLAFISAPTTHLTISKVTDSNGQVQALPMSWNGPNNVLVTHVFDVSLPDDIAQIQRPYLYLPAYEQRLSIWLNGQYVEHLAHTTAWGGPATFAATLLELPVNALLPSNNHVQLHIESGPLAPGSLSKIYIGTESQLLPHFRYRHFFDRSLKAVLFGMQLFLGLCSLIFVMLRRQEVAFSWLAMTMLTSCVFSVGIFAEAFPALITYTPWLLVLIAPTSLGFLGFVSSLANKQWSWRLMGAAILTTTMAYAVMQYDANLRVATLIWLVTPVCLISLLLSLILLTRLFWHQASPDLAFLTSGSLLLTAAVLHDQLTRLGIFSSGILIALPTRLLTLIGLATFMMTRLATITRDLDKSKQTLSTRLQQKEAELAQIFARDRQAAEEAASTGERNRIVAELHDGVAGHLSTIVALSDTEQTEPRDIQVVARHALAELRMLIDTMTMPEADLRAALAAMCERSVEPLKNLHINADWSFARLPNVTWLTPEQTLSILRILQEALSNAVRHGKPTEIHLVGEALDSQRFALRVTNQGGVTLDLSTASSGYGIENMRARTSLLGGTLELQPIPTGASLCLCLPISPPPLTDS